MDKWWIQLQQDWLQQSHLDAIVLVVGLVYVLLSARNHPLCWPFGIVSCAIWGWISYAQYALYLDALLQLFYVAMGFWGLYLWWRGGASGEGIPIRQQTFSFHWPLLLGGAVCTVLFGYFFARFTPAAATYFDAFTTVFSVIATWLLVHRYAETWLYWIVTDAVYIGLYWSRGAILLAVLMIVYTLVAVWGWAVWRRQLEKERDEIK